MKQNITLTFCYFIYLSLAVFLHPVSDDLKIGKGNACTHNVQKQESMVAKEKSGILHSELLLQY